MNLLLEEFVRQGHERVADLRREREGKTLEQEAADLSGSLAAFVRGAWHCVWPNQAYSHGWHIDAICEHLEAVSENVRALARLYVEQQEGRTAPS